MKRLLILAGPPCTGKSTVARLLGFPHLEMDEARATLLPEAAHTRADRAIAYRAVRWAAAKLLAVTHTVVLDGGFGNEVDREENYRLATEAGARLYLVEFEAPLDVLIERNRLRRGRHPGLDLDDRRVTEIASLYPYLGTGLRIDGSEPIDAAAARIVAYLGTPGLPKEAGH